MQAELYNLKNAKVGTLEVSDKVFGEKWRPELVKQVLLAQQANRRLPWAHAKDRSEVRGGGKKPWRQKGTGRARHGSTRSPIWVGGGKAHGPRNERDYSQKVNKKMKRVALLSVLSRKYKDGEVKFIDSLTMDEPKTKALALNLKIFFPATKKFNVLLVPNVEEKKIYRASRNLQKAKAMSPEALNVEDVLNYKHILMDQLAVAVIAEHYAVNK